MNTHRQTGSVESTAMRTVSLPGSVRHIEFALPDEMQDIFIGEVRQRLFEMEVAIAHNNGHALGRAASSLQAVKRSTQAEPNSTVWKLICSLR